MALSCQSWSTNSWCVSAGRGGGGGLMGLSPRPHVDRQVRGGNHSSEIGVITAQTRDFRHVMRMLLWFFGCPTGGTFLQDSSVALLAGRGGGGGGGGEGLRIRHRLVIIEEVGGILKSIIIPSQRKKVKFCTRNCQSSRTFVGANLHPIRGITRANRYPLYEYLHLY